MSAKTTRPGMRWVVERMIKQEGRCHYCRITLSPKNVSQEHIVPRCFGGPDRGQNRVLTCHNCNSYKAGIEVLVNRDHAAGTGLERCAHLVVQIMALDPRKFGNRSPLPLNVALAVIDQADRTFKREAA